jgi:hypothetical protein
MVTDFLIWHDFIFTAAVPVSEWALRSVTGNVWWRRSHTVSEPSSLPANTMWHCVGWCVTQLAPIYKRTTDSKCGSIQVPSFKPLWYILHTFLYTVRSICTSAKVWTLWIPDLSVVPNQHYIVVGHFYWPLSCHVPHEHSHLINCDFTLPGEQSPWYLEAFLCHSFIDLGANIRGKVKTYG